MADGLADLQRWMLGALRDQAANVGRVVASSPTMTPEECLEVYRGGYHRRLLECMREMHPGFLHLAGDELFEAFALDYLAAHPPAGYSLSRLGDGFADHLDATRPDDEHGLWADLVIEVVRFEQAFLEVYDGPGVEGHRTVWSTGAGVVGVTPVPCLRVLRSRFPVGEYVGAVRRGETPPVPAPQPTFEVLVRRAYVVERVPLTAASCAALEALLAGASPGEAARAAGVTGSEVLGWITVWAERGLFSQVSVAATIHHPTVRSEATCS